MKRLLDTGISLQNIRIAVDHLRDRGVSELSNITLVSDGSSVYECTSPEEMFDLIQGGQGVFGIAVSGTMKELTGSITHFPAEHIDNSSVTEVPLVDELADMRRRRERRIG